MNRTKNTSRNIFWGLLNKVVALGLPFITRTVMIYTLGMDYIGLGSLFSSILQVLSFAELGIGSALVFSMYKPIADGNDSKVCALLNLYRKTYRTIGGVILAGGLLLMPFLKYLIAGESPVGINLQILFAVYLLNNIVGYFLFAYKQSLFTASQRVDMISKIGMGLQALLNLLQIAVLLFLRNYYIYVVVIPVITILNNISVGIISEKVFPQYKCFGSLNTDEMKLIQKKIGGMFCQKIGNIILTSADTIVISSFLGLKVLGIYNGYYYVITALLGFLGVVQQAMVPAIGNSVVLNSVEKNYNDFNKFQFLYLWIVIWWCACLSGLYQPFIKLWQGTDNMLPDLMVALFVIYFFTYKMGDVCWMYREAMGLWWEARYVPLISAVTNFGMNLFMVNIIGLPGILISTIFSIVIVSLPFNSKVLFSKYFYSKRRYWIYLRKIFFYFIEMCFITTLTWEVCSFIQWEGVGTLIVRGIICVFFPNFLLIVINIKNSDFRSALQFVLKIIPGRFVPVFIKRYVK